MEFNPNNSFVKLCIQGMDVEGKGIHEEAVGLFRQAWNQAADEFERFTAAYHVARLKKDAADKLEWYQTSLRFALVVNIDAARAALPFLYSNIAKCYDELGDWENSRKNSELANSFTDNPTDDGPFYHGTKSDMRVGDMLTAGHGSNYEPGLRMNHIYFTALSNGAGLAAALAKGDGRDRVYIVEPTGNFENDPNVTNKKFPGNPTRSYRTQEPLKIIGELADWARIAPEELQKWREKLANNMGGIIN